MAVPARKFSIRIRLRADPRRLFGSRRLLSQFHVLRVSQRFVQVQLWRLVRVVPTLYRVSIGAIRRVGSEDSQEEYIMLGNLCHLTVACC